MAEMNENDSDNETFYECVDVGAKQVEKDLKNLSTKDIKEETQTQTQNEDNKQLKDENKMEKIENENNEIEHFPEEDNKNDVFHDETKEQYHETVEDGKLGVGEKTNVEEQKKEIEKTCLDEEVELHLTEQEKQEFKTESITLKNDGNQEFKQQNFQEARDLYTKALQRCPKCFENDRATMFANRGACYINMEEKEKAISDCTEALTLNPAYMKALIRRAHLYEETDKLDEALEDYKLIVEKDRSNKEAIQACMRLPGQINERNEKMKEEMMGKLKDLGNLVLRPFGLSTNNFQMQQNPDTGSYNIQFVQNAQQPPQGN